MIKGIPKNTEFRDLFIELIKLFKPKVYMELGTKNGYIFNSIAPLVERAIAIDCNGFNQSFYKHKNAFLFDMTTDDLYNLYSEEGIFVAPKNVQQDLIFQYQVDFLFIDACHEKEQVLKDFDNFSKFVKEDIGLIFLHDTYPTKKELTAPGYCHNAYEAAWEIRNNATYKKDFEIVTLPGPFFGLSIIRKATKQVAWEE